MQVMFTAPQTELLGNIRGHLALLDAKYDFTSRLARENGWKPEFARKVVDEYAKFLFIAREGSHHVSPPYAIDQAWHLHLVHTEDYWGEFCPKILQMQLHHSPATGGAGEAGRFAEWSGQTLTTYRKFFGAPPRMWLPARKQNPRSQATIVGVFIAFVGILIVVSAALQGAAGFIAVGFILVLLGLIFAIAANAATKPGSGSAPCGSSCGGTGCGSSDSGHSGGHGGHSCGGGHGCGGHGCGGGGCGGGGH